MQRKKLEKTIPAILAFKPSRDVYAAEAVIQNVDGKEILEVDIWDTPDYEEKREMLVRHFVKKETGEYGTFHTKTMSWDGRYIYEGSWSKLKLASVLQPGRYYYGYFNDSAIALSPRSKEVVEKFIGEKERYSSIMNRLAAKEENYTYRQQGLAIKRKEARIERLMDEVAPVESEEFTEWIHSLMPETYIFVKPTEKRYRCSCTSCGESFYTKDKPKHNSQMNCKKCGSPAIVKTRTERMSKEIKVMVPFKFDEDRWMLRHFKFKKVDILEEKKAKSTIEELEKVRMFMRPDGTTERIYYGQYMKYGADEFSQDWWDKKTNAGCQIDKEFYVYGKWLNEIEMPVDMKRVLKAGAETTISLDYNAVIRFASRDDCALLEYLIRGRFGKLTKEIISIGTHDLLDTRADNIQDLLQLDGQRVNRLRDMNGGRHALDMLQEEIMSEKKISQENLEYAESEKIWSEDLLLEKTKLSANKALNYIRRQKKINDWTTRQTLQHYKDYLLMAEERGADLTDPIICLCSRMKEFHDKYTDEKNREADEKREQRLKEKYPHIKENYDSKQDFFEWKDKEYSVIVPENVKDIMREGRTLHHCVASSDQYFESINRGYSYILFLRKNEEITTPYYTLEVKIEKDNKVKILQSYGAYDRRPNAEEVDKVLRIWRQEAEKRVKKAAKKTLQAAG